MMGEDRPPGAAAHRSRVHYGWVIVITSTLTVCACLGIARFSLGMLLPGIYDDFEGVDLIDPRRRLQYIRYAVDRLL